MSASWSRRAVLAAAAGAALSGCGSGGSSSPPAGPSGSGGSPVPPSAPSSAPSSATSSATSATSSSAAGVPWDRLARTTSGELVRPGTSAYDRLRRTPNPRYDDARPLALLEVSSADDVATGLRFAADHDLPVALRSGGHSYPGWSSGGSPRALVIDCRDLADIAWDATSVTIGPGATLGTVYDAVGGRGRAVAGGSCPTVGLGGLTLGGGVGVLTRAYGLTCDRLTAAEVVLADGRRVTASADHEPDLFWALRGGGGGHLGVTTSLTFDTFAAPTLSTTYLTWPASAAADVVPAWFDWLHGAAPELWSTLKLLAGTTHPDGPSLGATVTWVGAEDRFEAALAPILATRPTGRSDHRRGFLDAMRAYGGSGAREAFAATSHVAYAPPDAAAVTTLSERVAATPPSLKEAGVSIDALGGRVADVDPGDTAFVHRRARATVQYTATWDGSGAARAISFVHGLRTAMTQAWGDHAYVNYADATLRDPGTAYFGSNWGRLQRVRANYDPHGFFTQPQ